MSSGSGLKKLFKNWSRKAALFTLALLFPFKTSIEATSMATVGKSSKALWPEHGKRWKAGLIQWSSKHSSSSGSGTSLSLKLKCLLLLSTTWSMQKCRPNLEKLLCTFKRKCVPFQRWSLFAVVLSSWKYQNHRKFFRNLKNHWEVGKGKNKFNHRNCLRSTLKWPHPQTRTTVLLCWCSW